ncbi:UNVERIFIED_CONTAM: Aspartic proteinase CDR1 [Sesamum angustifolium]|uniref:Aspartic proteinase CDR1 n=1 Tax=Sesamum angustifolium TaxID=2727405 RepID=A0AAW2N8K5_9LAMI
MVRTMKVDPIVTACTSLIFAISMTRRFHLSEAQGFSIDLLSRDFLQSPSLVSSSMSSERVTNALRRSFNRVNVLTQDYARLPSTDVFPDKGEYLMKFSIGTPPVETLAIADTGSDLTWIRCNRPSSLCLHQKAPLFEPTHSSTYKPISCTSSPCNSLLGSAFCDGFKGICRYTAEYGDGSFSNGDLAAETMKLGTVTIPNVTIGCGYHDKSSFGASASGIAGLGGGKASLITKMGPLIRGKFSYCLVPHLSEMSKSSKMSFGDHAVVSGHNVVTTPIVARPPNTFYFLTLEAITIGNKRIDLMALLRFHNGMVPSHLERETSS